MNLLKRFLLSGCLLFIATLSFAQEEKEKSGMQQKLELYTRMYADFLSVYAATYAGEHNEQLESIQNQVMDKGEEALENKGYTADLSEIKELLTAFYPGSTLETSILEFQNTTGLKVYLTGKIDGYGSNRIASMFNKLSYLKHPEQKVAPFLEVFAIQQRDSTNGHYTLSVEVVPSSEVNVKKAAKYFNEHFEERKYESRSAARKHLKGVLLVGFAELEEKIGPAYVPALSIKHEGVRYRNGDKIEVAQDTDGEIILSAVDKEDGVPEDKVNWTVYPNQGSVISDNQIRLKTDEAGYWDVTAKSGEHQSTVVVEVVNVPLDWKLWVSKLMVRLAEKLIDKATAQAAIDEKAMEDAQAIMEEESVKIQAAKDKMAEGGSAQVVYAASIEGFVVPREIEHPMYSKFQMQYKTYFRKLLALELSQIRKLLLIGLMNEKVLKQLVQNIENDLPELAGGLTAAIVQGEETDELKEYLTDFLNKQIDRLIQNNMHSDIKELYYMLGEGASREELRQFTEEIVYKQLTKLEGTEGEGGDE